MPLSPEFRPPNSKSGSTIERNSDWKAWYPTVIIDFREVVLGKSPYGEPNQETLKLFSELPRKADVLDVGGGDGRYALPIARMGHNVTVLDIDEPHLERLKENAADLPEGAGRIDPLYADATKEYPLNNKKFDAVICAGLAYLMPPEELKPVFARMAEAVKSGGILVLEFATNRERRDKYGNSLIGEDEYLYTRKEGEETLTRLYGQSRLDLNSMEEKTIHFKKPYYMHNELIIAKGTKNTRLVAKNK